MKPQVMTISTTILNEEQKNGEIPTTCGKLDILHVKEEPKEAVEFSESETSDLRDAPGPRHSHHRKKMMEKWMNVNDGSGVTRRHLSPRNHDTGDPRRSSKSPSSPPPGLTHIPADPRKWTALHVGSWLEAVAAKYTLAVNKTDFQMNGRALCLMRREGFLSRVPKNGAILFEDFRRRLRQYLTACRQRVRTTYASPGSMSLPGRMPHFPMPAVSGASQIPNSPLVQANAASPWIAPFSALRGKVGTDRNPTGVPGVSTVLHAAQPTHGPLSFLHPSPFGLSNTPVVHGSPSLSNTQGARQSHGSPSLSNTQGARQSSSRNIPNLPPPSQAGPSTSTAGQPSALASHINGHILAAASRLPIPGLPSSGANTVQPCPMHSAPSTLHTTLPTSNTTNAPRTATTHAAPTQSTSVTTSCPVHSSSSAPDVRTAPSPYMGNKCYLHPSPYYQFVPIYRTMRVVGQFQPIPYGYPSTLPPSALPTAPSESSNQSQTDRNTPPSVTPQSSNQSQALDLSTSSNNSPRPVPSGNNHVSPTNERKRIKTEPL